MIDTLITQCCVCKKYKTPDGWQKESPSPFLPVSHGYCKACANHILDENHMIQKWLLRICAAEGGYVNKPNDPGGETKWGISKRTYPQVDIKMLTLNDACIIYKADFIDPLMSLGLENAVLFQLLDFAIHSGTRTAIRCLQGELKVARDGIIGPSTLEALRKVSQPDLVMMIVAARLDLMTGLSTWPIYSRGWVARMTKNLRYGAEDTDE